MEKWENAPGVDQRVLDRLVDGELTGDQERAVLEQLERTPGGWRHCALAFLEARCWRQEVMAMREQMQTPPLPVAQSKSPSSTPYPLSWRTVLAAAAVLLIAVGVGTYLPQPWGAEQQGAADRPASGTATALESVANSAAEHPPLGLRDLARARILPVANLTFVDDSGRQVQVPIFNWDEQVADQLLYRSQPLPNNLLRSLKRHEVRRRQRYVPVELEDGRHAVVPVQELDIVPVSVTTY